MDLRFGVISVVLAIIGFALVWRGCEGLLTGRIRTLRASSGVIEGEEARSQGSGNVAFGACIVAAAYYVFRKSQDDE